MAGRSRRSSTAASSMATENLARQRTEMQAEAATRYPTGKRKASRPKRESEPKPKKPRRPRRWAPPGWDGNRWSARSVQPGGLETHHEPCMSSFLTTEESSSSVADRSTGRLSWLRPRNSVSIWEHYAEMKRRAEMVTANERPLVSASGGGVQPMPIGKPASGITDQAICGSSSTDGVGQNAKRNGSAPWPGALGESGESDRRLPGFAANSADGNPTVWPAPGGLVVANAKSRMMPTCTSSSSSREPGGLDVPVPKTPAVTCPADRVSIMSLVHGP